MKEEMLHPRPSLRIWLTNRAAFTDLWVAFNLGGFGLMFALLGLILIRSQVPLPADMKSGLAMGISSLGVLLVFACARLIRARRSALVAGC